MKTKQRCEASQVPPTHLLLHACMVMWVKDSTFFTFPNWKGYIWKMQNWLSSPFSPELEEQGPRFKTQDPKLLFCPLSLLGSCLASFFTVSCFRWSFALSLLCVSVTFLIAVLSLSFKNCPRLHQDISPPLCSHCIFCLFWLSSPQFSLAFSHFSPIAETFSLLSDLIC